ncbi:MAG: hypothetical protein KDC39_02220 [Actinobacteria bacterium]|nr:hypothetical protein [Actinomycetota bacterium]
MTKTETPKSRPALRRAPDADLHPALVVPQAVGTYTGSDEKPRKSKHGKGLKKADASADKKNRKKQKTATLSVEVPKSLRKELRKRADRMGTSQDEIVVSALAAWLGDNRWW